MSAIVKEKPATPVSATRRLCEFLSALRYDDLPRSVVMRTEDLFLDWLASAFAGRSSGGRS